MNSPEQLTSDLQSLGVRPGDLLFIHSSFKSIGAVQGGADGVIAALEAAVGPTGTLLMPSFNLIEHARRAETWNVATTPSTVGYLTEFFRTMPGTVRSDHYSHAVAARGHNAAEFVAEHRSNEGMDSRWDLAPWGKTYGSRSPMAKAYDRNGKVLLLGVDYHSSTYIHYVEVIDWNRRKAIDPEARYMWIDRDHIGEQWDRVGPIQKGRIGDADSRLFAIRDFVDTLTAWVKDDPEQWRKRG